MSSSSSAALAAGASAASSDEDRIFVSIIAYRDSELVPTLHSLFSQATQPQHIVAGVVWQGDEADATDQAIITALEALILTLPAGAVRQTRLSHTQARGPCYARAMAQQMFAQERFYLQLDSHMRVSRGWDVELCQQWRMCDDERAILTTYPPAYERDSSTASGTERDTALPMASSARARLPPTVLCASHFDATDGMLRIVGRLLAACPVKPLPSAFLAAGFLFGPGSLVHDAPYDPHLQNLFFGEETSLAARLFTHGYNFFAPTHTLVWHCWSRAYRPNFRELLKLDVEMQRRREQLARQRVRHVLGMVDSTRADLASAGASAATAIGDTSPSGAHGSSSVSESPDLSSPVPPFTIGSVRSLAAFYAHTGVDFALGTVTDGGRHGGIDPMLFKPADPKQAQLAAVLQIMQQQQDRTKAAAGK
jgi:[Skp1-protein]-hydroxyproline N-acetylglucosaminyltransferase